MDYYTFVYFVWMAINLPPRYHKQLMDNLEFLINCSQSLTNWNNNNNVNYIEVSN